MVRIKVKTVRWRGLKRVRSPTDSPRGINWAKYMARVYYHMGAHYYVDHNGDMQWEPGVPALGTPEPWPVRHL